MSKRPFSWSHGRALLSAAMRAALACVLSCSRVSDRSAQSAFDAPRPPAADGGERATYFVRHGVLRDRCGEPVVLRGVNHPTLYVDRDGAAFAEIAKTGANSVRIFWAVRHHMLPLLELRDSTCTWALDPIVSYWTSPEALASLTKYQAQLIVNIANEASPPDAATLAFASLEGWGSKSRSPIPRASCIRHCARDHSRSGTVARARLASARATCRG